MEALTRAAILAAEDLETLTVSVPSWGGAVHLRTLTAAQRDAYEGAVLAAEGVARYDNVRARLLVLSLTDAQGARLFTDEDIARLGAKSAAILDGLFALSTRLNETADVEVIGSSVLSKAMARVEALARDLADAVTPAADPLEPVAGDEPRMAVLRGRLRSMVAARRKAA